MANQQNDRSGISAVALFDYQATDTEEISFVIGDVITGIEMINLFFGVDEWWRGWCKGHFGLFPSNYVQLQGDNESSLPLEELSSSNPKSPLSRKGSFKNRNKKNHLEKKCLSLEHQNLLQDPIHDAQVPLEELSLTSQESTLSHKKMYREQHKKYREEKKRLSLDRQKLLEDPALAVHSNWLKVRGLVKKWTKLWCVLKPGMLLLYKTYWNQVKSSDWVGTVLLKYCELMERPSKIEGYNFTLFHPYEESIWAKRGPDGNTIKSLFHLLPSTQLILNVPTEMERKTWMHALRMAIHSSSLTGSTLSLLSLPGIREAHKSDGDKYSKYQDTSLTYESDQEQESDEESLLWIKDDNNDYEDSSSQDSSHSSSEEGVLEVGMGAKKKEKPRKYVRSVVERWESFKTQKDERWESFKTQKDERLESFKTQKEERWENFKTHKDNLVERIKPHIKTRKHSYTVNQQPPKKKKVYIMNYITFPRRIINHYGNQLIFDLREGATKDSKNLRITFEKLGYEVILRENMTIEETNDFLDNIEQEESLEFILLFVLSHGIDEDTFFLSDGLQYSLRKIQYRFTDKKCPHLRGKSKIILSNFCRGINEEILQFDAPQIVTETPHNMITIHAAHEGFKAGRTPKRGTLFVHNLCKVLNDKANEKSNLLLQDVFNQIYQRMSNDIGQTPKMEVSAPFAEFTF